MTTERHGLAMTRDPMSAKRRESLGKRSLSDRVGGAVDGNWSMTFGIRTRIRRWLAGPSASNPFERGFLPIDHQSDGFIIPRQTAEAPNAHWTATSAPIPPAELRLGYGRTEQDYLDTGRLHFDAMRQIARDAGRPIEAASSILDFGCGAGRLTRWLIDLQSASITGVDIDSAAIAWARENLSPPFEFYLTTLLPHLPFEDRSFQWVIAGSVFTHIDDLALSWLMELRRVVVPGGMLYLTIHDHRSLELLQQHRQTHWLGKLLSSHPRFDEWARQSFNMFTIGRGPASQVFINSDWLIDQLRTKWKLRALVPEAYAYQSALLFERL